MREDNYTSATTPSPGSFAIRLEAIRDLLHSVGILFTSLAPTTARLRRKGSSHDRHKSWGGLSSEQMHDSLQSVSDPTPNTKPALSCFDQESNSNSKGQGDAQSMYNNGVSGRRESRSSEPKAAKRLTQSRSWKSSPWSAEIDHDKEWELRKDLVASANSSTPVRKKSVGRCVSDCSGMRNKRAVVRTRSLTDADLDELRGCIDLGFGFKNEADPELWETLPALELCYAISQQFKEVHGSPASSFMSPHGTDASSEISDDHDSSSLINSPSSWEIASPGDEQVKTRLRHWARAVACTVRQSL